MNGRADQLVSIFTSDSSNIRWDTGIIFVDTVCDLSLPPSSSGKTLIIKNLLSHPITVSEFEIPSRGKIQLIYAKD